MIAIRDRPTVEELRRAARSSSPLVARGLSDGWPAARWTTAELAARFGAARVTVARVDDRRGGQLATDARAGFVLEERRLADALSSLDAPSPPYVMTPLAALPDGMRAGIELPAIARGAWLRAKLWISPTGAVSPLHRDAPHNLHCVLDGRKRFLLCAPGETRRLSPRPLWSSLPNVARVDAEAPDLARHPRFARVHVHTVEIGAGEALLLPSGWWHQVRSLAPTIAVNFWWATGWRRLLVEGAELYKRARRISR